MKALCIVIVLLVVAPFTAFGQTAHLVWTSHNICYQQIGSQVASVAKDGNTIVALGCEVGPLVSTDFGRHFRATMAPVEATSILYGPSLGTLCGNSFVVAGADRSWSNDGAVYRSTDAGASWSKYKRDEIQGIVFNKVSGDNVWLMPGEGQAKIFTLYTTDCGISWMRIPPPDSLGAFGNLVEQYIGDGRFVARSGDPLQWYEVDYDTRTYKRSTIPDYLTYVYRLADSSLFGVTNGRTKHTFYRMAKGATEFSPVTLNRADGSQLDSMFLGEVVQLPGGALLIRSADNAEIFFVHNATSFGQRTDSVDAKGLWWSGLYGTEANTCLMSMGIGDNDWIYVMIDAAAKTVRKVSIDQRSIAPRILMNQSRNAMSFEDDGRVLMLDLATDAITIGGTVEDEYARATPFGFDVLVKGANGVTALDQLSDLSTFRNDTTVSLVSRKVENLSRQHVDFTNAFKYGQGFLWSDNNKLLVGGTNLTERSEGAPSAIVRTDTTTFYTSGSDGRSYAGFTRPYVRSSNAAPFQPLANVGEGRSTISAMVENADASLVLGLRGYVSVSFDEITSEEISDTLEGGIWTSSDGGVHWTQSVLPSGCEYVYSISQRPSDSSLWASCTQASFYPSEPKVELNDLHLLRSADGGRTWERVGTVQYGGPLVLSECNIAYYGAKIIAWTARDRVMWSDDDGVTWREVEGLPPSPSTISHSLFTDDGSLHLATSHGYYRVESVFSHVDDGDVASPGASNTLVAKVYPNPAYTSAVISLTNLSVNRVNNIVGEISGTLTDLFGTPVQYFSTTAAPSSAPSIDIQLDLSNVQSGAYYIKLTFGSQALVLPLAVIR